MIRGGFTTKIRNIFNLWQSTTKLLFIMIFHRKELQDTKGFQYIYHSHLEMIIVVEISIAMQQEPIYWRYLPYKRPIFQA